MHYVGALNVPMRLGVIAVHPLTDTSARSVIPRYSQVFVEPYVWITDNNSVVHYFDRFYVGDVGPGKRQGERCKWFDIWFGRWYPEGEVAYVGPDDNQCGRNGECYGDYHGNTTEPCFVHGNTHSCTQAINHGAPRFTITIPRYGRYCGNYAPGLTPNGYTEVKIRFAEAFDTHNDYREVFLRTQQAPQFTKTLSDRKVINTNGDLETHTFNFTGNELLKGSIHQIRFDPADGTAGWCGVPVGCIHIDYVKLRNPSTGDELVWEWNTPGDSEGWEQRRFYPSTPGWPEQGRWLMMPNGIDSQLISPPFSMGP